VPCIAGAVLFEPVPHVDERGFFCRTFDTDVMRGRDRPGRIRSGQHPADVSYRIDRAHDPAEDVSIAFDDPELAISWPLPVAALSRRDRLAQPLAAATRLLT
jgi:dTDP-4-dehydrorhamnose 3,5-epimerase-like enzyme